MALLMRLTDGVISYDLDDGTLRFIPDSWRILPTGDGLVTETMTLVAPGTTTDANIITAAQTITELAGRVEAYFNNRFKDNPVRYIYNATNEDQKDAVVHEIILTPISKGTYTPLLGQGSAFFDLTIVRDELFEDVNYTEGPAATQVSTLGGHVDISAIDGSAAGRMRSMGVLNDDSGAGTVSNVWMGLRAANEGTTSFESLWECEDGTAGTDHALATSANASPSAGSNNYVVINFATPSLARRMYISVDDVIGDTNFDHFLGRYLVLCRCMLSSAGTVDLQMRTGYTGTAQADLTKAETIPITNTSYEFVELGEISIPPFGYKFQSLTLDLMRYYAIHIYAERISGTPSLYLDCLVLIPSEIMFTMEDVALAYLDSAELLIDRDGRMAVLPNNAADEMDIGVEYTTRDMYMPLEGGIVVVAADTTTPDPDDDITIYANYYPRHRVFQD